MRQVDNMEYMYNDSTSPEAVLPPQSGYSVRHVVLSWILPHELHFSTNCCSAKLANGSDRQWLPPVRLWFFVICSLLLTKKKHLNLRNSRLESSTVVTNLRTLGVAACR